MDIINRLKHLRKDVLGLSQEEFGKKIGLSKSNISNIEVGRIVLTERNLQDICVKYRVNKNWLIDGEGDDDNIFLKPSLYEIAYNRFGYIMENAIPSKRAALSVLLELVYATPDEQWEALMEQYNSVIAQTKGES